MARAPPPSYIINRAVHKAKLPLLSVYWTCPSHCHHRCALCSYNRPCRTLEQVPEHLCVGAAACPHLGLQKLKTHFSDQHYRPARLFKETWAQTGHRQGLLGLWNPAFTCGQQRAMGVERWGGLGIGKLLSIRPTTSRTVRFVVVHEKMRITKL